jgi:uncharacterized protein (DUF305 family)
MAFSIWRPSATLLFLSAAIASGQTSPQSSSVPLVQPGAPGQSSKTLSPATAGTPRRAPVEADVYFMQGMIHHHSQAVEMVELLRTHGSRNPALQALGKRISISQTDEIEYMKKWLTDRGQATTMPHHMEMGDMKGMDHSKMAPMMMPGMLTPEQMQALAKASGPAFDHLFLTGMIQHHTGALIMVEDLFDTPGAGQDAVLFDFATDIDNTQRAEIKIMQGMLLKEKK